MNAHHEYSVCLLSMMMLLLLKLCLTECVGWDLYWSSNAVQIKVVTSALWLVPRVTRARGHIIMLISHSILAIGVHLLFQYPMKCAVQKSRQKCAHAFGKNLSGTLLIVLVIIIPMFCCAIIFYMYLNVKCLHTEDFVQIFIENVIKLYFIYWVFCFQKCPINLSWII